MSGICAAACPTGLSPDSDDDQFKQRFQVGADEFPELPLGLAIKAFLKNNRYLGDPEVPLSEFLFKDDFLQDLIVLTLQRDSLQLRSHIQAIAGGDVLSPDPNGQPHDCIEHL